MLFVDVGDAWQVVTEATLQGWGVSPEAGWRAATDNLRADPVLHDEVTKLAGGIPVRAVFGASRFSAARLLALPQYLDLEPAFGAIVGVPSDTELVGHAIRSRAFEIARNFMVQAVAELFNNEETNPLSPHLYWWREGQLTRLTEVVSGRLEWKPPADFEAMAEGLADAS